MPYKLKPDIVFLDMQMPLMPGFDALKQVHSDTFHVIFFTAFNQYAIKAIRFSALDYLLKPVDIDELQSAINRIVMSLDKKTNKGRVMAAIENIEAPPNVRHQFAVPTGEGMEILKAESVIFCEAEKNYTHLHLTQKRKMLVSKPIKEFENLLSDSGFLESITPA